MNKILPPLFVATVLAFSGCESPRSPMTVVREKFSPTYHTHTVAVEPRAAYDLVRRALDKMGYKLTSGGQAQGKLEAIHALQPGDGGMVRARQVSVKVKLEIAAGGGTEVSALFLEILDDSFGNREGMGTAQAMQETGLYDVFFTNLDREVAAQAK